MVFPSYKLIFSLLLLLLVAGCLCYFAYPLAENFSTNTLLTDQATLFLFSYFPLGLGFAIPLIVLATLFGWLQFILLMTGHISPHLAKEGFFKVVETLFRRI